MVWVYTAYKMINIMGTGKGKKKSNHSFDTVNCVKAELTESA